MLVGQKDGSAEFGSVGRATGEKTHTLTVAESAPHSHGLNMRLAGSSTYSYAGAGGASSGVNDNSGVITSTGSGGGGAHNNIQPSRAALVVIKT